MNQNAMLIVIVISVSANVVSRVDQQHLPDDLAGRRFYDPGENDVKPD